MNTLPIKYYELLLAVHQELSSARSPKELLEKISETLQSTIGYTRLTIRIHNKDSDTMEWFSLANGLVLEGIDFGLPPQEGSLTKKAVLQNKTFIVDDLRKLAEFAPIQIMLKAGLHWAVALPLTTRQISYGAFCFSFSKKKTKNDDVIIRFLEKLSIHVASIVENLLAQQQLHKVNQILTQKNNSLMRITNEPYDVSRFFYRCENMRRVIEQAKSLAQSNLPVLLLGETGTGKDFLARLIHNESARCYESFVKVNCPAISPTLFESELFGHAKGSFTGAYAARKGRLEIANNGTIFFDEIGDLDASLQAKLLQVLQESRFERVGESQPIAVDIRLLSATNLSIEELITKKQFREDLYYRFSTTIIRIPPLRERKEEIPELLQHLITVEAKNGNSQEISFSSDAIQLLLDYSWPGNLREFSNLIKHLMALNTGTTINANNIIPLLRASHVKPFFLSSAFYTDKEEDTVEEDLTPNFIIAEHNQNKHENEKNMIIQALKDTNGVISGNKGAAKLLNIPRSTLLRRMKKYGISTH